MFIKRAPLQIKITIVVLGLLLISNILLGLYLWNYMKMNFYNLSLSYVKNLAQITDKYITNLMLTGNSNLIKGFINMLTLRENILGIHIFDNKGNLTYSVVNKEGVNKTYYDKILKNLTYTEKYVNRNLKGDVDFYSYYKPLYNSDICKKCHINDGPIIGLLNINVDSSKFILPFERKTLFLIYILGVFSLFLSSLITYLIKRLVTEPLKQLENGMESVTSGDLTASVNIKSGDELETLSIYFNSMVESLKNASETLNNMHKNMFHTDRLMTVGQSTAAISHEIKNPVNSILILADIARSRFDDLEKKDILKKLDNIITDCEKINKIIDQTLRFSKYMPEDWELIDISKFLKDLQLFAKRIFFDRININFRIIDKTLKNKNKIRFSRVYLEQIFINLLKNAFEAVVDKGGGNVILSVEEDAYNMIFKVSDTGKGIDANCIVHIFDEFYTTKQDGTGLGLSIVKYILEMYNSSVYVKSIVGSGTTFTVEIPVYRERI